VRTRQEHRLYAPGDQIGWKRNARWHQETMRSESPESWIGCRTGNSDPLEIDPRRNRSRTLCRAEVAIDFHPTRGLSRRKNVPVLVSQPISAEVVRLPSQDIIYVSDLSPGPWWGRIPSNIGNRENNFDCRARLQMRTPYPIASVRGEQNQGDYL
jgi:hypothetical protein